MKETRNLPEGRTNSLVPPSVPSSSSKEFFASPPARSAKNVRKTEKSEEGGQSVRGAPVRQLNFSSFGTQLETQAAAAAAAAAPPRRGPGDGTRWALPAPAGPRCAPPVSRRVLRPLIPTFTRRTSAIANESRLAEPEPAATRFCVAPPVRPSLLPRGPLVVFSLVSSILSRRSPPHTSCPSFFFLLLP